MVNQLSADEQEELLKNLEERFLNHMERHPKMKWAGIKEQLLGQVEKIEVLAEMERTGGEPDVVGNEAVFVDCSAESPKGRRSVCYDQPALKSRKKNKPKDDAQTLADEIGIEILNEEEYRSLQEYGKFDLKSSSWVHTPDKIRKLGGAIFCDCRYDTVFTYHNSAESYYSARGFRGKLVV